MTGQQYRQVDTREPAGAAPRFLVVGSGVAGLYAALLAAEAGLETVLLSKAALADSNTSHAQGGISAVLEQPFPGDTVAAHIADTLRAGAGHCNEDAVRIMCTQARKDIAGLRRFGVAFDLGPDGDPALGREGAHSAPRILHSGGDATGLEVSSALIAALLDAQSRGSIRVITHAQVTSFLVDGGRVAGVNYLFGGRPASLEADAVLLATGGAGQLFSSTTNPAVATADGLALAWRAGAAITDLEFFQFHPTCLIRQDATSFGSRSCGNEPLLISEAVRGEGAILIDANGTRFLAGYHADAELAPRDVVSRSIFLHLAALGDPTGQVFLDARVIEETRGAGFLERRFPTLSQRIREAGIDWTREPVPVAPAAHYWMGGVSTDLNARTSLPGLYAAGEVACTGVQGANRLASNSLLEGLVFARRAVEAFLGSDPSGPADSSAPALDSRTGNPLASPGAGADPYPAPARSRPPEPHGIPAWQFDTTPGPGPIERSFVDAGPYSRDALRRLMTGKAGVLRNGAELAEAAAVLARWAEVVNPEAVPDALDPHEHEDANLMLAAQLLVHAALERRASLGAHYRSDSLEEVAAVEDIDKRYTMSRKASLVHD